MRQVTTKAKARQAKPPVLAISLIALMLAAGTAFAATGTGNCGSDKCVSKHTTSDDPRAALAAATKAQIESIASLSASLPITAKAENRIVRDETPIKESLADGIALSELETSGETSDRDAVERLLERRLLEKSAAEDTNETELKSTLPGVGSSTLQLYRERMYRTDI